MKITASVMFFFFFFIASSCGVQQLKVVADPSSPEKKFEPTLLSTRRALSRGEIKEALASYESQANEAEKNAATNPSPSSYWKNAVIAYSEASRAARLIGQLQKAITYGARAMEVAVRAKSPELQLRASEQLALAHRAVNDFDRARELTDNGLKIVDELAAGSLTRLVWEANLYDRLGEDLYRRRDLAKAIDSFNKSVSLTRRRLARVSRSASGGREEAIESARITLLQRVMHVGNAYRQAGRVQEALKQYQNVLKSITRWKLRYPYEPNLYAEMAEVYFEQREFARSLENLKKALAMREGRGQLAGALNGRINLRIGDVYFYDGKTNEAILYYQRAVNQVESLRSLLGSEKYRQVFFESELDSYVSMIGALVASAKLEEAFHYSERTRARVFLDILGTRVQLSRLKSGLFEEERALQERIAAIKASLAGEEAEAVTDRNRLQRDLADAEKAYTAFLARVRKQDKEQASLMAVEPLTLTEVQKLLDPATTLVEYFVTGSEIYVWVVEKDRLHFQKVELLKNKLSGLVKALRESIFTLGEREKFNESSASLYKQLIEPLLPHVTGKELIIVPHDVLHYLPFHALQSPDGKYLIERYPIYYLSSASLLQFVKEKRRAGGEKVLAFGNPDLGDPEKNLEFAELEAQEVKAAYPDSVVYVKKEATEEKSKSLSPSHDILHFATHAELNENDPLSSAVLLAKDGKEDGRLEVREIFGMDLKANLVVLSGCETGLGKLSTGDELVGLTRAFIYAGTPSVVASLWKVDDSSTAHLMSSFYKNLKTMSKVEALRQAQMQLIRGEGHSELLARRGVGGIGKLGETLSTQLPAPSSNSVSTSHPYFWAPFILVGDGK
jgi:CHAT domain-containing protein